MTLPSEALDARSRGATFRSREPAVKEELKKLDIIFGMIGHVSVTFSLHSGSNFSPDF
jgi:hypothetical protein